MIVRRRSWLLFALLGLVAAPGVAQNSTFNSVVDKS